MYSLSPRNLITTIPSILAAGLVPHLSGPPGAGKSAVMRAVAKSLNLKLIDLRLSALLPEDINGVVSVVDGFAKYLPFRDIFPLEDNEIPEGYDGWLLFLDELPNASEEVQKAIYQLLLDRQVGQHSLHQNVLIATAGNRKSDRAAAGAINTAIQSRVVHLHLDTNLDEWINDVALANDFHPTLVRFLMENRDHFHRFSPDHGEDTYPCPRTWDFLNSLLTSKVLPIAIEQASLPVFAGVVGASTALTFLRYATTTITLPTMQEIIFDPSGLPVPDTASKCYGVICSALSYIKSDTPDNELDAILKYVSRMSPSHLIVFGRLVQDRRPDITQTAGWSSFRLTLGQAIASTNRP